MCAAHDHHRPGLLAGVFRNKCSRCRRGDLFLYHNPYDLRHVVSMAERCPVCGQPFEIEVGFWYGTGFVSYALAVIVSAASFIAWLLFIGMSLQDHRLFWWMGVNALLLLLLQPPLMRLSRTIWLNFFVWYDPEWREHPVATAPERSNAEVRNDW